MDDEVARQGIREELTTRDEYLETRFTKLSQSGYDLTPMTDAEVEHAAGHLPSTSRGSPSVKDLRRPFLEDPQTGAHWDRSEKGLYACVVGGLPLFTSGHKAPSRDGRASFYEPCDPEHLREVEDQQAGATHVYCARSGTYVGQVLPDSQAPGGKVYVVNSAALAFHPLGKPLPVECQPENYWGSEGQYRAWSLQGQTEG